MFVSREEPGRGTRGATARRSTGEQARDSVRPSRAARRERRQLWRTYHWLTGVNMEVHEVVSARV